MTINKAHLVNHLYRNCDLSREESSATIEALLEIIKHTLESGEDILISGFGKFIVKEKTSRRGRNPETGDDMKLRARRIVMFKCSGVLRRKIEKAEEEYMKYKDLIDFANEITPSSWNVFVDVMRDYSYKPGILNIWLNIIDEEDEYMEDDLYSRIDGPMIFSRILPSRHPWKKKNAVKPYRRYGSYTIADVDIQINQMNDLNDFKNIIVEELAHIAVTRWKAHQLKPWTEEGSYFEVDHNIEGASESFRSKGPLFQKAYETLIARAENAFGENETSEMRTRLNDYRKNINENFMENSTDYSKRCYEAAYKAAIDHYDNNMFIVHGYIYVLEDFWIIYAWCEIDDKVYDYTEKQELFDKDEYYKERQITEERIIYYDYNEYSDLLLKNSSHGPFDLFFLIGDPKIQDPLEYIEMVRPSVEAFKENCVEFTDKKGIDNKKTEER